jgi:ABC-2 type transport system ATP-binding protein
MWQAIRSLASDGVTIFLTTQYLEEADRLADHIALLDDGKLVAEGTAEELKRLTPGGHISLKFADPADFESDAAVLEATSRDDNQLALQVASDGGIKSIRSVLDRLENESIEADSLTVHTPDLDDVFFALTGQTTTNDEAPS